MLKLNKNIKIIVNYLLGPAVFCLLAWYIYKQLQEQQSGRESLLQLRYVFNTAGVIQLGWVVAMMFINWGLEAFKWQQLMKRLRPVSFMLALKAVFAGTTWAIFTPNRVGDLMGRALFVETEKRAGATALTLLGSMAQLWVTFATGIIGIGLMAYSGKQAEGHFHWMSLLLAITAIAILILTLLFFRLEWLVQWAHRFPRWHKQLQFVHVLDQFKYHEFLTILLLSFIRYTVFLVQYFLLFDLFQIHLSLWDLWGSVSVVFLIMAIVPSLAMLTELGVRGQTSIGVFSIFTTNLVGIVAVTFMIWLINLVIPALIGSYFFLQKSWVKVPPVVEDPNGSVNFDK